jgi:TPR repeat protein
MLKHISVVLIFFCVLPSVQFAGVTDTEKQLFADTKASAENGDYVSLVKLGEMYATGRGVEKDLENALRCLRFAAMQGVPRARYLMGMCYLNGVGVLKDEVEAYAYFSLASDQNADAKNQLISLNESLTHSARSLAKERHELLRKELWDSYLKWYEGPGKTAQFKKDKRLALEGDPEAQVRYSCYFLDGTYERQDLQQADYWCKKSASQNCASAFAELSVRHLIGKGVKKDMATAMNYAKRAADFGHKGCQAVTGTRYMEGDGVAKNFVEAYAYLRLSGEFGVRDLELLRSKMNTGSIAAGERRASVMQAEIDRRLPKK